MSFRSSDDLKNHETSDYITKFVKNYEQILYDEVKCFEYYPLSGTFE